MNTPLHKNNQKFIFSFTCIILLLFVGVLFYIITLLLNPVPEKTKLEPFLKVEGQFSLTSSSSGMGITIDPSMNIPDKYIIEWNVSGGKIYQWNNDKKQMLEITNFRGRNPITFLNDSNKGSVIWAPFHIGNKKKLTLTANLYKSKNSIIPLFYDKITLKSTDGITFQIEEKKSR